MECGWRPKRLGLEGEAANEVMAEACCAACPPTDLDQLLNDLQGNGMLVDDDRGLARLAEARLDAIRRAALAEAAAAALAEQAWAALAGDAGRYADTWIERNVLEHLHRLHEHVARWQRLADHAALYLGDRALARDRAGAWLAESRIKDEWPGR